MKIKRYKKPMRFYLLYSIYIISILMMAYMVFPTRIIAADWTGPEVKIIHTEKNNQLFIDGKKINPVFLTLNTEVTDIINGNWSIFDYELGQASKIGIPIVSVYIRNKEDAFLDTLFTHLNKYPNLYVMLRLPMDQIPASELMKMMALDGTITNNNYYRTLSEEWINLRKTNINTYLNTVNIKYPNRIIGVVISYLDTGEWFTNPRVKNGITYYYDYSLGASSDYCTWLLTSSGSTSCNPPSPMERSKTSFGNIFHSGLNNDIATRAITFNTFHSERIVNAITSIAREIKTVTQGKAMVSMFYGYTYELGTVASLPGSGHLALQKLLESPYIDAISSPYSYSNSRTTNHPFIPMGPMDSPAIHNKMWIHEDDTRTYFCSITNSCDVGTNSVWGSITGTIQILRRNILTTGLHNGNGLYVFDLWLHGWFGRPDKTIESDALWKGISGAIEDVKRINTDSGYMPEVAIFSDDTSYAYLPLQADLSTNGVTASNFLTFYLKSITNTVDNLTKMGVPVRHYLVSDLLKPGFPTYSIKFAIFLNTFKLPTPVREAIRNKLQTKGKTLLYFYADGLYKDSHIAVTDNITDITGLPVMRGDAGQNLSSNIAYGGVNTTFGEVQFAADPWFYISPQTGITKLGMYVNGKNEMSVAQKDFGTHKVIYSAAFDLPKDVLRVIATNAGVHFFSSNVSDIVDSYGNSLMIYATQAGTRTITLPFSVAKVMLSPDGSENLIANNTNNFTVNLQSGTVAMIRWENIVPNGYIDSISSSGLVKGWAADPDIGDDSTRVHFYLDGTAVSNNIGAATANGLRADVFKTMSFGKYSGFSFQIPIEKINDGRSHKLFAFILNKTAAGTYEGANVLIGDQNGTVIPIFLTIPGDLNGDSHVNIFDYNILVAGFGNPYTIFDYNTLVANYGK